MTTAKYTARFTTAGRITAIESWLDQNIKGKWSFKLENVSEDMSKKDYVLMFDDEVDRNAFRTRFTPAKRTGKPTRNTVSHGRRHKVHSIVRSVVVDMPVRAWIALGRPFYRG
jgi:hypothetical protein